MGPKCFALLLHWFAKDLQWAMPLGDYIEPSRGNLALCRQIDKPQWLAKHQFLTFGSLRAFPNPQLRNLFIARLDRTIRNVSKRNILYSK